MSMHNHEDYRQNYNDRLADKIARWVQENEDKYRLICYPDTDTVMLTLADSEDEIRSTTMKRDLGLWFYEQLDQIAANEVNV